MKCIVVLLLAIVAYASAGTGTVDVTVPEQHTVKTYKTVETPVVKTYPTDAYYTRAYVTPVDEAYYTKKYVVPLVKTYRTYETPVVKTYKTYETYPTHDAYYTKKTYKTYEVPVVKTYKAYDKPVVAQFAHEDYKTYPAETKIYTVPKTLYYEPQYYHTAYY